MSRPTWDPGPRAHLTTLGSVSNQQLADGCAKAAEEAPKEAPEDTAPAADKPQLLQGAGICKWFNVPLGFVDRPHQGRARSPSRSSTRVSCTRRASWNLKEGEAVEESAKGVESNRAVTRPGGVFCIGSERQPKGKNMQKRTSKGDRYYNCGGLDHHAKECTLPPQPKKCHCCQSINHMVHTGQANLLSGRRRRNPWPCSAPGIPRIEPQWVKLPVSQEQEVSRSRQSGESGNRVHWGQLAPMCLRLGFTPSSLLPSRSGEMRQRNSNHALSKCKWGLLGRWGVAVGISSC
uniref:CCHC-type domain-containing protein n=1 Tax=Piliocolobus tephrosceles TaxID=591936 RepID=A0A8C9GBG3_9PRIM